MDKNVLLIDDNDIDLEFMSGLLCAGGYNVRVAQSGPEGIEIAAKNPPDLILCDLMMGGVDGYEVARRLEYHSVLANVPILAVTASATIDDRNKVLESYFNGYVPKPINAETFAKDISTFLDDFSGVRGGKRALIADDDETMRDVMCSLLTNAGYTVIQAASGREALRLASNIEVSIAFIDLVMPDGNGLQTCAALRAMPNWRNVPIIILTHYSIDQALSASLHAGASGFVCKPLVPSELLWCLDNHTRERCNILQESQVVEDVNLPSSTDPVDMREQELPPADSKWILRFPPGPSLNPSRGVNKAGPSASKSGTNTACQPLITPQPTAIKTLSDCLQPPLPMKILGEPAAGLVDTNQSPDIDAFRRIATLFPPGAMVAFLNKLVISINELLPMIEDGRVLLDRGEIERLLHNLAGTAGTLGCGALTAVARELEADRSGSAHTKQRFAETAHAALKTIAEYSAASR